MPLEEKQEVLEAQAEENGAENEQEEDELLKEDESKDDENKDGMLFRLKFNWNIFLFLSGNCNVMYFIYCGCR